MKSLDGIFVLLTAALLLMAAPVCSGTVGQSRDGGGAGGARVADNAGQSSPEQSPVPESEPVDPMQAAIAALLDKEDTFRDDSHRRLLDTFALESEEAGAAARQQLQLEVSQWETDMEAAWEDLIATYPDHSDPLLHYGNFFNNRGLEDKALEQWKKALDLNPDDPAIWNNIAGYHTHNGDIRKAFEYFEKAVSLEPAHWVYFHNFANAVFLFRRDSMDYYRLNEQQIFDKAFAIYRRAMETAPDNFELAYDVANSYYIVKPARFDKALAAWEHAFSVAASETDRQDVLIHLARWNLKAGNPQKALEIIDRVDLPEHGELRKRVKKNILRSMLKSPQ